MDVDLPFAARLGVETADNDKDKKVGECIHVHAPWRRQQTLAAGKYLRVQ